MRQSLFDRYESFKKEVGGEGRDSNGTDFVNRWLNKQPRICVFTDTVAS